MRTLDIRVDSGQKPSEKSEIRHGLWEREGLRRIDKGREWVAEIPASRRKSILPVRQTEILPVEETAANVVVILDTVGEISIRITRADDGLPISQRLAQPSPAFGKRPCDSDIVGCIDIDWFEDVRLHIDHQVHAPGKGARFEHIPNPRRAPKILNAGSGIGQGMMIHITVEIPAQAVIHCQGGFHTPGILKVNAAELLLVTPTPLNARYIGTALLIELVRLCGIDIAYPAGERGIETHRGAERIWINSRDSSRVKDRGNGVDGGVNAEKVTRNSAHRAEKCFVIRLKRTADCDRVSAAVIVKVVNNIEDLTIAGLRQCRKDTGVE